MRTCLLRARSFLHLLFMVAALPVFGLKLRNTLFGLISGGGVADSSVVVVVVVDVVLVVVVVVAVVVLGASASDFMTD